jgi:hypothetical protein
LSRILYEPEKVVALATMIMRICGKPCVCIDSSDASVFYSTTFEHIEVHWYPLKVQTWYEVRGKNSWIEAQDERPDSLTDKFLIGSDCLEIGPNWWFDNYFRWYFVFDSDLVARSEKGDHTWATSFLDSVC